MHPASMVFTRNTPPPQRGFQGFLSTGTAVAALAISLALSGCKGASAPATDDASLNTAIQNRLQADPGLAGQPVQVAVVGGVATLTGNVSNPAARSLAANDAAQIPGIRTVVNSLILGVPPTTPEVLVTPPPAPVAPIPSKPLPVKKAARIKNPPAERAYNPPAPSPAPIERQENTARNEPPPPPPPPKPSAPSFRNITIPADTNLPVRITQTLDSATAQTGDAFSGVLASDVVIDGLVALPSGSKVSGRVNEAKDAGHFSGSSLLTVSLTGVSHRGEQITITTDTFSKAGNGRGKNTAEKIGGGAAVGAILGGIFGGGKGAAIGAGAGGGLGAGANGVTKGQQVQIASESLVRFRLTNPVTVRVSTSETSNEPGPDLQRHDQ